MAKFYGTVKGAKGPASRTGTKDSGIEAVAQSWKGSVSVRMYEVEDKTQVEISVERGSTSMPGKSIFRGTLEELFLVSNNRF